MKKAFTLIELIVSIGIVSILVILLSSIFSMNLDFSNKVYQDDNYSREALNAILHVENIVREADEIEEIEGEKCNFLASVDGSSYTFIMGENNKLMDKIKGSEGYANNWIASIKDFDFYYDSKGLVSLYVEGLDGSIYKTSIDIGVRK